MKRNVWEDFAKADAEWYVLTADRDYASAENREFFFESGRTEAHEIVTCAKRYVLRQDMAIEIGCGVGRLAIPVASEFRRVLAVDISPTMLTKLAANCHDFGVTNIQTALSTSEWYRGVRADLVYSRLVFQHLENLEEVDQYLAQIRSCLADDGVGYFQFDTRPATLGYRLRNRTPDFLLIRQWRRGIRRIRRARSELASLFSDRGLKIVEELRPDTADHVFLVRKV